MLPLRRSELLPAARRAATGLGLLCLIVLGGCCGAGPGRIEPLSPLALVRHATELEQDHPRFTTVVVSPFVVIGDARPAEVRAYAHQVVGWATRLLQKDFFERHPRKILDIWLFKSELSYRYHVSDIFGETPRSPYGYYAPCSDALIVNGSLGGGTLVHEMVHAFMEANFDDAPTWFDEGLASLFEQPAERDGHLIGLTNWRLPALQRAIRAGRVKPLSELMATSRWGFYDADDVGLHYAMARYLLYYLQERDLLVRYYQHFRSHIDADSSGIESFRAVTGESDLVAFQRKWGTFVLGLSFAG